MVNWRLVNNAPYANDQLNTTGDGASMLSLCFSREIQQVGIALSVYVCVYVVHAAKRQGEIHLPLHFFHSSLERLRFLACVIDLRRCGDVEGECDDGIRRMLTI